MIELLTQPYEYKPKKWRVKYRLPNNPKIFKANLESDNYPNEIEFYLDKNDKKIKFRGRHNSEVGNDR